MKLNFLLFTLALSALCFSPFAISQQRNNLRGTLLDETKYCQVLVVGDSMANGLGTALRTYMMQNYKVLVASNGADRSTIDTTISQAQRAMNMDTFQVTVVFTGANDSGAVRTAPDLYFNKLNRLFETVRSNGSRVLWIGHPLSDRRGSNHRHFESDLRTLTAETSNMVTRSGEVFFDLRPLTTCNGRYSDSCWNNVEQTELMRWGTPDRLHFGPSGNLKVAEAIAPLILSLFQTSGCTRRE